MWTAAVVAVLAQGPLSPTGTRALLAAGGQVGPVAVAIAGAALLACAHAWLLCRLRPGTGHVLLQGLQALAGPGAAAACAGRWGFLVVLAAALCAHRRVPLAAPLAKAVLLRWTSILALGFAAYWECGWAPLYAAPGPWEAAATPARPFSALRRMAPLFAAAVPVVRSTAGGDGRQLAVAILTAAGVFVAYVAARRAYKSPVELTGEAQELDLVTLGGAVLGSTLPFGLLYASSNFAGTLVLVRASADEFGSELVAVVLTGAACVSPEWACPVAAYACYFGTGFRAAADRELPLATRCAAFVVVCVLFEMVTTGRYKAGGCWG